MLTKGWIENKLIIVESTLGVDQNRSIFDGEFGEDN